MMASRYLMKTLVGAAAVMALFTTAANAGCGCGFGFGRGYGFGYPAYGYAPYYYPPGPPRYFVNQGPVFGGPNVTEFVYRSYDPGYVHTHAYPFVRGHYGYAHPYARYHGRRYLRVRG